MLGASGTAACATRLTAAAPSIAAPAVFRKLRLVFMIPSRLVAATAGGRRRCFGGPGRAADRPAREACLQFRVGDPEIAQRSKIGIDGDDLLARIGEQLEHAGEHAVVAQEHLLRNAL